mmetsp:Transcript_19683/g.47753  ORF Transcript_19683/g.47753 Transcript_19683/m.47753 type:complete len:219 (-) Transcript_19683:192-848(-)
MRMRCFGASKLPLLDASSTLLVTALFTSCRFESSKCCVRSLTNVSNGSSVIFGLLLVQLLSGIVKLHNRVTAKSSLSSGFWPTIVQFLVITEMLLADSSSGNPSTVSIAPSVEFILEIASPVKLTPAFELLTACSRPASVLAAFESSCPTKVSDACTLLIKLPSLVQIAVSFANLRAARSAPASKLAIRRCSSRAMCSSNSASGGGVGNHVVVAGSSR